MSVLGIMIDSWGKKDVAEVACEKIIAAEKAAVELEKAQAALAAAQAVAEKAKAEAEKAVHNLPPVEPAATEEVAQATPEPSQEVAVESEDARIARIVVETLTGLGVVPQAGSNQAPAATAPAPQEQVVTVVKAAEELTLAPAPVAGPSSSKGGNYPAAKQHKQRR